MGEWVPFYISLGILLVLGVLLPVIVGGFLELEDEEPEGILVPIDNMINEGVTIGLFNVSFFGFEFGTVSFDIFNFIGETARDYFSNVIRTFSIIPLLILVPLIIIVIVGFVYSIIKIFPFT